jgi:NTE family protein
MNKQKKFDLISWFIFVCISLSLLGGCATIYPNPKLEEEIDLSAVIRKKFNPPDRSDELLFVLTLSGGGTRAAALAYGVMEALEKVRVPTGEISAEMSTDKPLLKEVDIISSVSGGSFTAAYYGLHGDRLFDDFKDRFLYRKVQSGLVWRIFNPVNWVRFMTTGYGRSNMAAKYYDEILFDDATFADMLYRDNPLIMIQTTDIIDGYNFSFTPYFFSLLCSDLREVPVSFAVTASSSLPGAFNGLSLYNYGGTCGNEPSAWVHEAIEKHDSLDQAYWLAKRDLAYRNSEQKKYVHLFDGGVSDNLGLRSPFSTLVQLVKTKQKEKVGLGNTKRVVFVIVNSQVAENKRNNILSNVFDTPGTRESIGYAIGTIMNSANFDTIHLLKEFMKAEANELTSADFHTIHLSFDSLEDPDEVLFFENVATALQLPEETVDKLIEVGGRLLYKNKNFQRLVNDMGGTIPDLTVRK